MATKLKVIEASEASPAAPESPEFEIAPTRNSRNPRRHCELWEHSRPPLPLDGRFV